MNKKDFHNIRNQFNRMINSFDQSQISTQKIISICFDAQNNLSDFLNQFSLEDYPIFLSNNEFSAYSFGKEYSFSFYSEYDYKSNKDEMIKLVSDTLFINSKNHYKTFIFGGLNFDLSESNNKIWNDMPVGHFTLPRYTFTDSKLIINLFLDNKVSFNEINQLFSQYIDNLERIFIKNHVNNIKSELLDISDLESHDLYHRKINNFLETFKRSNSDLIKVVFSRIKKASFSYKVPLINIYKKLLSKNSRNMNFLYSIKDDASVIGSTPELILSKLNHEIQSESIAGSNYSNKTNHFTSDKKEVIEQKIVTDYIIEFFKKNTADIKYNDKPKIKKLSNIEHLCTSFSARLKNDKNILDLLIDLHPTPAIGGYPKEKAIDMIRSLKENRGWYGGPLGWIDNNLDGQFYLNIRSGLGVNKDLYLFSGSGITEKSNSDNEWDETEYKFKSMLESL
tara:strand:+ start:49 stop:1401 length:1353 start_codon:yes stop_codon:yes gene_type:complete